MAFNETRTTLLVNTAWLIGNICQRSVKYKGIDLLFETHGAERTWRSDKPIGGMIGSKEINRAYGWMVGINEYAQDQAFVIARDVLLSLARTGTIVTADDRRGAAEMINRIETFFGMPSSFPPKKQFHQSVINASSTLLNTKHYAEAVRTTFEALLNAVKDMAERPDLSGDDLMTQAFNPKAPILRLSVDANEQKGWMFLFGGAVAVVRNPLTHDPNTQMGSDEAMELLDFASFLFRTLDRAQKV